MGHTRSDSICNRVGHGDWPHEFGAPRPLGAVLAIPPQNFQPITLVPAAAASEPWYLLQTVCYIY